MLQRTKGRLLLALLVITGMAGTVKDSTLSQEERKFCVTSLKKSRNELLSTIKDLSPAQLNFRPAGAQSVADCIFHVAAAEKAFDQLLEEAMNQPSSPDDRTRITYSDDELVKLPSDLRHLLPALSRKDLASWSSPGEAIAAFVSTRSGQVKYVRNTTEDLRNHVIELLPGRIDCYQLLLMITHYSNHHLQEIRKIISDKNFPRS